AELACDAWVVSTHPEHRRAYAKTLVDVAQRLSRRDGAAPALGVMGLEFRNLEGRLKMILRETVSGRDTPLLGVAAVIGALLALPSRSGAGTPATPVLLAFDGENGDETPASGIELFQRGDYKAAIRAFEREARDEDGDGKTNALYNVACCYARMGDREK